SDLRYLTSLVATASVLTTMIQVVLGAFTGLGRLREMTLLTLSTAVVTTLVHVGLVLAIGSTGQFISAAASAALVLCIALALSRRSGIRPRLSWDRDFARHALRLGGTSLIASIFAQIVFSSARFSLARRGGAVDGANLNGQFQAAYAIGANY